MFLIRQCYILLPFALFISKKSENVFWYFWEIFAEVRLNAILNSIIVHWSEKAEQKSDEANVVNEELERSNPELKIEEEEKSKEEENEDPSKTPLKINENSNTNDVVDKFSNLAAEIEDTNIIPAIKINFYDQLEIFKDILWRDPSRHANIFDYLSLITVVCIADANEFISENTFLSNNVSLFKPSEETDIPVSEEFLVDTEGNLEIPNSYDINKYFTIFKALGLNLAINCQCNFSKISHSQNELNERISNAELSKFPNLSFAIELKPFCGCSLSEKLGFPLDISKNFKRVHEIHTFSKVLDNQIFGNKLSQMVSLVCEDQKGAYRVFTKG